MLKKIEIIPIHINININPTVKLLNTLLESIKNNNQIIKNGKDSSATFEVQAVKT